MLSRGGQNAFMRLSQKIPKIETYDEVNDFFTKKDITITTGEYIETFKKYENDKSAFVFIDPPYFNSFNASYNGHNGKETEHLQGKRITIDNTKIFVDILRFLEKAECRVMCIINSCAMNRELYKNFMVGTYSKHYDISGRDAEHLILCNYDPQQ